MKNNFKKFFIIISSLLCFSCIRLDEFSKSDPEIIFNHVWDDKDVYENGIVILEKDTLRIEKLEYIISDILLINKQDTIVLKEHKMIKLNNRYLGKSISVEDIPNDTYKIVFTFGLKDVSRDYQEFNAQNFNTKNKGYYFLKLETTEKNNNNNYNLHIAKEDNTSYINSFQVEIEDFYIGALFVNQAIINVNLKNLFTNPNIIDLKDLTSTSIIQDSIKQSKLIENAKNIFYLNKFEYD